MRRNYLGIGVSLGVLLLGLGLVEIGLRRFSPRPDLSNERNTLYRYDAGLGWRPKSLYKGTYSYEPDRPVRVQHNAMGFRDREHGPKKNPVLAVIGDSYVYGFNVEQEVRFTEVLQKKMPGWDIYNFGVSGYGTDQETLLLEDLWPTVRPDAVLLIFCANDHEDNSTNRRYGYYKPYFDMRGGRLELRGIPVPKSLLYYPATFPRLFKSRVVAQTAEILWRPLARHYWPTVNVLDPTGPLILQARRAVEARGAKFAVGFIGYGPEEKNFCAAARLHCFEADSRHVYETPGGHWDPEGHREVAEKVYRGFASQLSR